MKLIYPGSFDPITNGHIDIINRGAGLSSCLIVAVLDNPAKKHMFSASERADMIKDVFVNCKSNIEVDVFSGLLADFVKNKGACAILRGLRNSADYLAEYQYFVYNKDLSQGVETLFLPCSPNLSYISSSIIKEASKLIFEDGRECSTIDEWVPQNVKEALKSKFFKG